MRVFSSKEFSVILEGGNGVVDTDFWRSCRAEEVGGGGGKDNLF